jgi:hypothetical protein
MTDQAGGVLIDDQYEAVYTEKLWSMLPEVYRYEDGAATPPGALRALIRTWAKQAAALRRSQDRAYADLFIELCSRWAVPYIGDLVGTRLISAFNPRGQRIDVAKTIYYRQGAGTLRVLEELIADITGWEGVVTEGWKRLARTPHNLDLPPTMPGRLTRTPRAGSAELRRSESAHLVDSPFDEFYHTPDMRRDRPYGIPKITFHLYRLNAVEVRGIDPRPHGAPEGSAFTIDPSGRDVPLFARRSRPEFDTGWRSALEYELPAPIPCRLLADAHYRIPLQTPDALITEIGLTNAAADDLRTVIGVPFRRESDVRARLSMLASAAELTSAGVYPLILRDALQEACGKAALLPSSIRVVIDDVELARHELAAANLSEWEASPLHKRALIDPERGRLLVYDPAPQSVRVDVHYGSYMPFGAGGFTRTFTAEPDAQIAGGGALPTINPNEVTRIDDSLNYTMPPDVSGITQATIAAADPQRPYLALDADWTLTGEPASATNPTDGVLTLDGLWLSAEGGARRVILAGDFEQVTLRYCTFDPGGIDSDGDPIPAVTLHITGYIELLVIERCALGAVRVLTAEGGAVETIAIRESVIQSRDPTIPALRVDSGMIDMAGVTVMGGVDVLRLYATDCLITGLVDVTDTQDGCFRFSAARRGSRLPHPYESAALDAGMAKALFRADEYGQPDYAMLSYTAPENIARGGENGAEMGVFQQVGAPYKRDGLNAKIAEFMPFGLIPVTVWHT